MLKAGDQVPAISGLDQDGHPVALADLWAKGPLVLFFYPKDFTPVCTREACQFRDIYGELAAQGVQVVGVSGDDAESHRRFRAEHRLPYPLLSDGDRSLAKAFGIMVLFGLRAGRVTFIIDRKGIVRGVYHHELSAQKHVDGVLETLKSLTV